MARIRTIKPDFFKNEQLAELPAMARLLFIGLWTQADREGKLEDRPKRLKIELFPYENYDLEKGLKELEKTDLILRYKANANANGRILAPEQPQNQVGYILIKTFLVHQQPNAKEAQSHIPNPTCASTVQAPCLHDSDTVQASQEGKGKEGEMEMEMEGDNLSDAPNGAPTDQKVSINKWIEGFDKRKIEFQESLYPYTNKPPKYNGSYEPTMLKEFFDYWSEPNKSKSKMRWEQEKTWELPLRLSRWAANQKTNKITNQTKTGNVHQTTIPAAKSGFRVQGGK